MSAFLPERVSVHSTDGHVEVSGLDQQEVEFAISLYRAVSTEQVGARAALASHVNRAMLEEGIPLVPAASQKQVQRSAELRRRLLEEHGAESYATLAQLRGSRESSARTWVSRARGAGGLLTVELQGRTLIPTVQLTDSGEARPQILEILRPLLRSGADGWSLWAWLTSPTGLLSGEIPAEVAEANTHRAYRAAERYATELRQTRETERVQDDEHVRPMDGAKDAG